MSEKEGFDWIPFYGELARKLPAYRARQRDLIAFLEELRAQRLTITPLEDQDKSGRRFLLKEIDPFTFFGCFNRGIANDKRIRISEAMKSQFGVRATVPSAFSGVPTLPKINSWFISFQRNRKPSDVDRLWEAFTLALGDDPLNDERFAEAFDRAIEVRNTNLNLTMGLFWIRPDRFISLDRKMQDYLSIDLPKEGLSFDFYRDVVKRVRETNEMDFPHLSYSAHLAAVGEQSASPVRAKAQEINEDIDYWMVGAYWHDADPPDQTERFLAEGIWENCWEDRLLDQVKAMKVGDRIAIKAAFTKKHDLPFDNRGNTVSGMTIKATGTIVKNHGNGKTVEVNWDPVPQPARTWYFYTYQPTLWRLRKDRELAQRLIRFAFYGEPQDYAYFVRRWWDEPEAEEDLEPISESVKEPLKATAPYGPEDMIDDGVFLSKEEIELAIRRLEAKKNLILQGAPGVGKTFIANRLAYALMGAIDDSRVTAVQFHPSYSYEDFVRGYRPTDHAAQFALSDGPFVRLCNAAGQDPDHTYVLVVDEINRANLSQVFGELFLLLEGDKRGKRHAVVPLYPRSSEERFFVPENVYVIGTMNIADRSLALVDFALRRRFAFFDLEPRFGDPVFRNWLKQRGMADSLCQRIITRMSALNTRIEKDSRLGPAFQVGHSFFCPNGKDFSGLDEHWYAEIIRTEILPLLSEYWFDAPDEVESARSELLP